MKIDDSQMKPPGWADVLESYDFTIGYTWDPKLNRKVEDVGLSVSDLLSGLGVFGEGSTRTSQLIAAKAAVAGYRYFIFDFNNNYRNILYVVKEARVLRLGSHYFLDALNPEGLDIYEFIDIFLQAYEFSYGLLLNDRIALTYLLTEAYEKVENGRLTVADLEDILVQFELDVSSKADWRSTQRAEVLLRHLLKGETGEAVSGPSLGSTSKLIESGLVTVLELGHLPVEFRKFIQLLITCKYLSYLQKIGSTPGFKAVFLFDSAEQLFCDRMHLPMEQRKPIILNIINDLKSWGVGLHLASRFASEIDAGILGSLGTLIVHGLNDLRDWRLFQQRLNLDPDQYKYLKRLTANQAFLERALTRRTVLFIADRPSWIISKPLTNSQIEQRLKDLAYPISEVKSEKMMRAKKTLLESDFGGDAPKAYSMLKLLIQYQKAAEEFITQRLTDLPEHEAVGLLERLRKGHYVKETEEKVARRKVKVFKPMDKAVKAIQQFESKGQSTLPESKSSDMNGGSGP